MEQYNVEYLEAARSLLASLISSQPYPFRLNSSRVVNWLMAGLESEEGCLQKYQHKKRNSEEVQGSRTPEKVSNTPEPAELRRRLEEIVERAQKNGYQIPLEALCAEFGLSHQEKLILLLLFFAWLNGDALSGRDLVLMLGGGFSDLIANLTLLSPEGRLVSNGLIKMDWHWLRALDDNPLSAEYEITEEAFWRICGQDNPGKKKSDKERVLKSPDQQRLIWIKEPEVSLEQLILPQTHLSRIEDALWQFEHLACALRNYGVDDMIPYGRATTMLFYGPPGTGKTATAEAIARRLKRPLGYVRYDQLYSKWFGDSEKNVRMVFEEARKAGCVLVFDEADACFGRRLDESHSSDRGHNLMTNILMQELERYEGLMILTTNRDFALDPAFERRLLLRLKFELPDVAARERIWQKFLAGCPKLAPDVSFAQLAVRFALSGGKIKNVVLKAVTAAAREQRPITMADLESAAGEEIRKQESMPIGF
ncbi:MAG: ATP-binding protein [candidate division WOR-3 bacterium]